MGLRWRNVWTTVVNVLSLTQDVSGTPVLNPRLSDCPSPVGNSQRPLHKENMNMHRGSDCIHTTETLRFGWKSDQLGALLDLQSRS